MKQQPEHGVGSDRGSGKYRAEIRPEQPLVNRQITDKFAGLTVHCKGVFLAVPCGVEYPHGVERIVLPTAGKLHGHILGNNGS